MEEIKKELLELGFSANSKGIREYVRTDKGYIFKIDKEKKNLQIVNFLDAEYGKIVKHSKQLIDLIEIKDLICFKNTSSSNTLENEEMIIHIFNNETLQEVKQAIEDEEIKIISILTKESYMANCYKVGRRIDMFKCKHKRQEEKNCYYENYYCVEYDIYCKDCGKYLGHWAYGKSDVEENLYFEKWYNRLFYSVKTKIKSFFRKNNYNDSDLPF